MSRTSALPKLLLSALLSFGIQACAVDSPPPLPTDEHTIDVTDVASTTDSIVLPMRDGLTHRLDADSMSADRIVLSDGAIEIPLVDLLGGQDLGAWTYLDLTTHLGDDGNWTLELVPGTRLARQARAMCTEWATVVQFVSGQMKIIILCTTWVEI